MDKAPLLLIFSSFVILTELNVSNFHVTATQIRWKRQAELRKTWPHGVVPFVVSSEFDCEAQFMIYNAMEEFHKYTCVRFVPRHNERYYVKINGKGSSCSSNVGYDRHSSQYVHLPAKCFKKIGIIIHELMHTIGFYHEHQRSDRDNNIDVIWDNISVNTALNYKKLSKKKNDTLGVPYDYRSIMHYPGSTGKKKVLQFNSIQGIHEVRKPKNILVPKVRGIKTGQREGFTYSDIEKIRILYKCDTVNSRNFRLPLLQKPKCMLCNWWFNEAYC